MGSSATLHTKEFGSVPLSYGAVLATALPPSGAFIRARGPTDACLCLVVDVVDPAIEPGSRAGRARAVADSKVSRSVAGTVRARVARAAAHMRGKARRQQRWRRRTHAATASRAQRVSLPWRAALACSLGVRDSACGCVMAGRSKTMHLPVHTGGERAPAPPRRSVAAVLVDTSHRPFGRRRRAIAPRRRRLCAGGGGGDGLHV